jgi:hypothetical protein
MSEDKRDRTPMQRSVKVFGALLTALVLAVVTAIGTGIGSGVTGLFKSDDDDPALISSSATEEVLECGTGFFVPSDRAQLLLSGEAAGAPDWRAFRRENRGAVSAESVVEVAIQGESARTITLTRVDVEVERDRRPQGAVFSNPCGDAIHGRSLHVDLDRTPPAVVRSSADPEGIAGVVDAAGRSLYKEIRFPWTVSVTDPLILRVVALTERCDCTWRAAITWRSGGRSGEVKVDNDGKGYRVVGGDAIPHYVSRGERGRGPWRRLPPPVDP